jgi:hypothetical protein
LRVLPCDLVADLLANVSSNALTPALTKFAYRLTGMDGRLVIFPYLRWFGLTARKSLRMAAQRILEWNPERLIVGHSAPIVSDAAAQLQPRYSRPGPNAPPQAPECERRTASRTRFARTGLRHTLSIFSCRFIRADFDDVSDDLTGEH